MVCQEMEDGPTLRIRRSSAERGQASQSRAAGLQGLPDSTAALDELDTTEKVKTYFWVQVN